MSDIEDLESELADQELAAETARKVQLPIDLKAYIEARREYGVTGVGRINVPHVEGMPTLIVVRRPSGVEMKRYRARVRVKDPDNLPDTVAPAEELADCCLIYPSKETLAAMCETRPGLKAQAGLMCVRLSMGQAVEEGKG